MREQNILFRRQNSIIYSLFTRSGFLKSRLNQPSVNGNSCFPFVAFLGQELLLHCLHTQEWVFGSHIQEQQFDSRIRE